MKFKHSIFAFSFVATSAIAGPILQMNKAFNSLMDLMPYLLNENQFKEKKNEKTIRASLKDLDAAFKLAGHDNLLKHDLFAPSYILIKDNVVQSKSAFESGKKDYAYWMLKEATTLCLDCHTRLPANYASSFQNGELTIDKSKLRDPYELGIGNLIVRRYVDAKESFVRSIQDKLIKKDTEDMILPFQQILLIDSKILKDPARMVSFIDAYASKKDLPAEVIKEIKSWKERLNLWKDEKALTDGLKDEKELQGFIKRRLSPLRPVAFEDAYKVDLLLASGILSNYFFENQESPSAAELTFWIGWIEKRLKREDFLSSGDLFFKRCINKYGKDPVAQDCFEEYRENIEFNFTGSSGTHIPREVQKELDALKEKVKREKK